MANASRSAFERSSLAFCSLSSRLISSMRALASISSVRSATCETKCRGLPRELRTSATDTFPQIAWPSARTKRLRTR